MSDGKWVIISISGKGFAWENAECLTLVKIVKANCWICHLIDIDAI